VVALSAMIIEFRPTFPLVLIGLTLQGITGGVLGPAIAAISLGLVGHSALPEQLGRNQRFAATGSLAAAGLMGLIATPLKDAVDAKRPNRERESLVGEQTRIVNRMKATLIRLGIRGFNPKLKKAAGRLEDLLELSYRRARSAIRTNVATTGAIVRIDCSTQYYKHRFCADGFWPPRIGTSETRPIA